MRDVGCENLRLVFAFGCRAAVQLRAARQDLVDHLARRVQQHMVPDREWPLFVGLLLEQLPRQGQLLANSVDLDVADLRVDA